MPGYKIVGADQKEYGPVSAEQLQQWIIEGRVNAQTQARLEEETEWKPLSAFPELAEALRGAPASAPPLPGSTAPLVPAETVLSRDYELDIGHCIVRSWELLKQNFWPVVGISALILVLTIVVNQIIGVFSGPAMRSMIFQHQISVGGMMVIFGTSLISTPIYTVLTAGLFKYYIKLIRAEGPTIGDAFSGFSPIAGQLILLGLVNGLLSTIGYLLCIIPGIYLTVSWIYAMPLVIDRNLPFWDAMELSRKVVAKHWFITFAFILVVGLLAVCGVLACCIGLFVTAPIATIAILYAYEDIFGRTGT